MPGSRPKKHDNLSEIDRMNSETQHRVSQRLHDEQAIAHMGVVTISSPTMLSEQEGNINCQTEPMNFAPSGNILFTPRLFPETIVGEIIFNSACELLPLPNHVMYIYIYTNTCACICVLLYIYMNSYYIMCIIYAYICIYTHTDASYA